MSKQKFYKLKIASLVLLACVIGILFLLPVANYFAIKTFYKPKLQEIKHTPEKHYAAIFADLALLEKSPLFTPTTFNNNAEEFLTEHVSWTGQGFSPLETSSHQSMRIFMKSKVNMSDKKEFALRSQDPLLDHIDTTWMTELSKYDHWNFSSNKIVQSKIDSAAGKSGIARIGIFSTLPIPDFLELRNFALIHFLQEYKKGRPEEGLRTMRQVANLMHSAGMLVSQMSAVAVLGLERRIASELKIKSDLDQMEKQIAAYKRLSWAWVGILQTPWLGNYNPQFEAYLKPEFGICGGVYEQVTSLEGIKEFLEPNFIFEGSYFENYERQRPFQKRLMEICQIKNYAAFFTDVSNDSRSLFMKVPSFSGENGDVTAEHKTLNYARIPYIRRIVGLTILTISSPNWMKQYEPEKP